MFLGGQGDWAVGGGVPRGQQEHVCVFLVTTAAMEQSFNVAPRLGG